MPSIDRKISEPQRSKLSSALMYRACTFRAASAHKVGRYVINSLKPRVDEFWPKHHRPECILSGSSAKATALRNAFDVDVLLSFPSDYSGTLEEMTHDVLLFSIEVLSQSRKQATSIGGSWQGIDVDLVPARRHILDPLDHSLWLRRQKTWTKTNIYKQNASLHRSGLVLDVVLFKNWALQTGLDVPSMFVERLVVDSCGSLSGSTMFDRVWHVLNTIESSVELLVLPDPGNPSNDIAKSLNSTQKNLLSRAATTTNLSTIAGYSDETQSLW